MPNVLETTNNYGSLSIKDLLEARDLYHYHLINKTNVVGTAIGRYLIRKSDPDSGYFRQKSRQRDRAKSPSNHKKPRTLENSEVRRNSWPCVHVFIDRWVPDSEFGIGPRRLHPEHMIPRALYLPDGRIVPVCVTLVQQGEARDYVPRVLWPGGLFGGGMPIAVRTQEREHIATVGCLVSDGHTTYALTSRHVCGDTLEPVYTYARGRMTAIGVGSRYSLTRKPFTDIYPEFAGQRTYVNLDVGLIELSDVNEWTSRYVDIGPVDALADLNAMNITLRLIDAPVVAVGAASGRMEGRIKALFYRYRSIGGYDYISDFLIAPREFQGRGRRLHFQTKPGDSGAVWHLVIPRNDEKSGSEGSEWDGTLRPLAMEWGGQVFLTGDAQGSNSYAFGLATNLTTVCRTLNVEPVLQHNTGPQPYWGQMGHYSIGSFACKLINNARLKNFFAKNIDQISFDFPSLLPADIKESIKEAKDEHQLIPLADVPDLLWKSHITKVKGGRDTQWAGLGRSTGPEHPSHYADVDVPRQSDGKTLMQLCLEDDSNISVAFWRAFYDEAGHTQEKDRGLLPFRVWQFFNEMAGFAKSKAVDKFLCAAGILSHYVGDACQPLHCSMYADGYKDQKTTLTHHKRSTGEEYTTESNVGAGVHSAFETAMIDRYATELVEGIQAKLPNKAQAGPAIKTGKEAAKEIILLMDSCLNAIDPKILVDFYISAGGKNTVAVQDALWEEYGNKVAEVMTQGAILLARIWDSAWAAGNGEKIGEGLLDRVHSAALIKCYEDRSFIKSLYLDDIGSIL
jgi:hypothetical protein